MLKQINLIIWVWIQSLRAMRRGKSFIPFLIFALLQGIMLIALLRFAYPPLSSVLAPIMRRFFGEVSLHYPHNFLVLPQMYNRANILLGGIVGVVVIGVATQMFAAIHQRRSPSFWGGVRESLPRYGWLFLVWLVETALILLIVGGLPSVLGGFIPASRLVRSITYFVGLITSAAFAYTTAFVVLEKRHAVKAISGSLSIFGGNIIISFFLVAIPSLFHVPIDFLARRSELLIAKFIPETVAVVILTGIGISIVANYLLVGTVTGFYLLARNQAGGLDQ